MSNIISIDGKRPTPPENEDNFYIKITFKDNSYETYKSQAFGESNEVSDFIIVYDVDPYKLHCLIHKDAIKKMEIFSTKEVEEYNRKIEEDFIEDYMRDSFGNIEEPEV